MKGVKWKQTTILILFFRVYIKNIKLKKQLLRTMDFTNALANNEEDLQDEDFYYD